jgi:hypothetical protein
MLSDFEKEMRPPHRELGEEREWRNGLLLGPWLKVTLPSSGMDFLG